jgi:hypothetical protein
MKTPTYDRKLNSLLAKIRIAPPYIANFDSATAMLRATSAFLRKEDFPGMGTNPPAVEPIATLINKLPRPLQEAIYTLNSAGEGIARERLGEVSAEAVADWMVHQYPQRHYPAVAIGSSSGALVHLCAALGIPWLPQTFLIPVQHQGDIKVDEPKTAMEWGRKHAKPLLEVNPELQLHHMHDPNQDRLTMRGMTYFRVKRLRLGAVYEQFLERSLSPGGTIFIIECQRIFPTTQIGDRHFFQPGGLGGATPEEFLYGSDRVREYLKQYNPQYQKWDAPAPDGDRPEAEWGFEASLRDDIERFARQKGYRICRVVFDEPEHLSPLVAELYRWWYQERQILANRLLVESFILLEPMWTLRTGSIPFWMKFNMEPSLEWIEHYLSTSDAYDEIFLMLFSHGVNCVGLPTIDRWREVFKFARKRGEFVGVEEDKFPRNFATLIRYYTDLKRQISARYPLPRSLTLNELDNFLSKTRDRFPVRWLDET